MGGGGGFGGPPPPRKRTGLIVTLAVVAVVVLAAVGITGFVAPGFFTSDDKGGGQTLSAEDSKDPDVAIKKLVQAADKQDSGALKGLACDNAKANVQSAIANIKSTGGAKIAQTKKVSDKEVDLLLQIGISGEPRNYEATVVRNGDGWCWNDIQVAVDRPSAPSSAPSEAPSSSAGPTGAPPSDLPSGGASSGAGKQLAQQFLSQVNAGQAGAAKAELCSNDSLGSSQVDQAISKHANLQFKPGSESDLGSYFGSDLRGTLGGQPCPAAA